MNNDIQKELTKLMRSGKIPKSKVVDGKIILEPNSWSDLEWWYEDEPENWRIIERNEKTIKSIMENENVTLKKAVDLFFERYKGNIHYGF